MKRLLVGVILLFSSAELFAQQNAPPLQQQDATPPVASQQNTPPLPPPPEEGAPPLKPAATPPPVAPIVVAAPKQPNGKIQKSLVRITSTEVEPDYRAPWNTGAIGRGVGAGFVIDGPRIMTNAHVVSNTRYLTVEREGDPNKYPRAFCLSRMIVTSLSLPSIHRSFSKIWSRSASAESPSLNQRSRLMVIRLAANACPLPPESSRELIFQLLHPFVDRLAPRHSDQRAN
jgi:U5 snRNP spliceosome subunit